MRPARGPALLLGVLLAGTALTASAHKFYASLAQVERTAAGRLEVSLRFFPDDLEAALRKTAGRTIAIENTKAFASAFEPWLNSVFSLQAGKQSTAFKYVGIEVSVEAAWVFVEAAWPEPLDRSSMKNVILLDLFPDQKNTVNLVEGKKRSSVEFSSGRTRADKLMSYPPSLDHR